MSLFIPMHKTKRFMELSVSEIIAYRRVLKKKMKYYQDVYVEATLAEEHNQDDYGILATAQAEIDFAECKLMRSQKKLKTVDHILVSKCIVIWSKKKKD